MTGGAFALLGSGEFETWTEPVDRWLVGRAEAPGDRILILPTASAAEGDDVFDMWAQKGLAHYRDLGIDAEVLPLKTRVDAGHAGFADALAGSAAVYLSGGNPAYLSDVLRDTPFWAAVIDAMSRGLAYAGCSAGVACLGDLAPDSARIQMDDHLWRPGLMLFPRHLFGPHWDALDGYVPGLTDLIVSSVPEGATLVTIDEDTAVVGDGGRWRVEGMGCAAVYSDGTWTRHESGSLFEHQMLPDDRAEG